MNMEVRPGLHNSFRLQDFSQEAKNILLNLERRWYLTNSGSDIHMGTSIYRYVLMKPTKHYTNAFGLDREICLLFSPYPNFEPRTLDAFDVARERIPGIRVDPLCRVLVSKDPAIAEKITSLFAQEPEQPIIIPFTYLDLSHDLDGS
ncbi:MAG: hypothetical protein Q8R49_03430, partial [Rhodoferax sp.]|nr:hypothetical protein [Rhodoferax sp.]